MNDLKTFVFAFGEITVDFGAYVVFQPLEKYFDKARTQGESFLRESTAGHFPTCYCIDLNHGKGRRKRSNEEQEGVS